MTISDSNNLHVVVGLGASGYSAARYLSRQGISVAITDSRANPPNLDAFQKAFPEIPVSVGKLDEAFLDKASKIIMSPGVSLQEEAIARQQSRGIPIIGDIELFAEIAQDFPVIAITGTNAKSTVTTLVGEMALAAHMHVKVGGNLGVPALELLTDPMPDLFVLELSSFQLETTYSLAPKVATILNITPDHMDRYATIKDYAQAKQRIYSNAEIAVCNRDDAATECHKHVKTKLYFTLNEPRDNEFGLLQKKGENYLAFENQILIATRELPILGRHYQANALASLAIGYGYGFPMDAMLQTLKHFKGLAHRCQLVRERLLVSWYNDSKGTNVGATLAAIDGLGPEVKGKLVLIAGGVGKNADFSTLVPAIEKYVKSVILIGEAAPILADVLSGRVDIHFAKSLEEAVLEADLLAQAGDSVLLSPACASLDMFKNFEHRGEVFVKVVQSLK